MGGVNIGSNVCYGMESDRFKILMRGRKAQCLTGSNVQCASHSLRYGYTYISISISKFVLWSFCSPGTCELSFVYDFCS